MNIDPKDPRLTAYALGELESEDERIEIEKALDVRRKENRMSAKNEVQLEAQASQEPEPSTVLEKKEELSRVLGILETLPPNQQEVIRLKFQNGLSYREISDVTHLSVSNVGFLLHTGLTTVRQKLDAWSRSSSTPIRRIK